MQTDTIIIGGGLSGLVAAWQLQHAGVEVSLLEGRTRFGGRVLTLDIGGAACDLGPSWFWPGQPLVAGLLGHFGISYFEQYADGVLLFQQADGRILKAADPSPMAGSLRVEGGIARLAEALAAEIDPAYRFLNHSVTGLAITDDVVNVDTSTPSGPTLMSATQVAIALPPRLAAELAFDPGLPAATQQTLATTPTWMAGHAKFFAIYDQPFWRQQGLCGTAISRRGPLAEIHDASPNAGDRFALFGFAGLDAQTRASMGQTEFIRQAMAQLVALFGEQAGHPIAVHLQDWSAEPFTAGAADRRPQTRHPQYGLDLQHGDAWVGKLDFISTETSFSNGGLIEGALESGLRYARRISGADTSLGDGPALPHNASMDWDWI